MAKFESITVDATITALLTKIGMTTAQAIKFGAPADVAAASMSADHLAQTFTAMAECTKSSEFRF